MAGGRRRRWGATLLASATTLAALAAIAVATAPPAARGRPSASHRAASATSRTTLGHSPGTTAGPSTTAGSAPSPLEVGIVTLDLVDQSRSILVAGGSSEPRSLVTYVRYPVSGPPNLLDVPDAPPSRSGGPYPLVVFGHGYDVTPTLYASLLQAWVQAGYVVAAPVFPLASPSAPGGPTEADLPNQPRDVSFVIDQLLAASKSPGGMLSGLVDPSRIAVAGQSDGGDTALMVGADSCCRDPRVGADIVLAGSELSPPVGTYDPPGSAPLLAVQGTDDTINPPDLTTTFFDPAPAPKYLLVLTGAGHLPPYTDEQPQLGVVERVSVAFLARYLKGDEQAVATISQQGNDPGVSTVQADP